MGVARGKSRWGSFPKGRRPRAGCGAEPHLAPQAKFFWFKDRLGAISKSCFGLSLINFGVFRPILEFLVSRWGFLGPRNRWQWSKIRYFYQKHLQLTSIYEIYAKIEKNVPTLTLNISNTRRARAKLKSFWLTKMLNIFHKFSWLNQP